jgi:hypothetical protein
MRIDLQDYFLLLKCMLGESLRTFHFINVTMVSLMKKIRFVSMLAAMALLLFGLYGPSPVSGVETTIPPATCSSATTSTSSTTSTTVVCAEPSTPTPRSPGRNSNLTIDLLPQRGVGWMECTFSSQRYCYEAPTFAGIDGIEVPSPMTPNTNCHNNDFSSTELCSVDGSDWLEVGLSGNFSETDLQNTYRWKLRTGKLSPDIMMMGDTQKSVIGGNATDGWTIEIWAKPALKAYLNGCYTASTCPDTSVASSVSYSLAGYIRTLGIEADEKLRRWPSVGTESLRSALRGTFISTNGMSQSWTFSNDTFSAMAVSPHFLPPDSTGKSAVTPGYVKIFLPETYLTLDRGYKDLSLVTSDRIKLTVSGQNATAKVTRVEGGILVDTGVEHFSAPNPEMSVLKANGAATSVVTETTPTPFLAKLKKGSSKTLSSIAKTKASQKPKWTASGKCKILKSKLIALKLRGTCKVTLRVLNLKKKYVVQTTKTFKVS